MCAWQKTPKGKKILDDSRAAARDTEKKRKPEGGGDRGGGKKKSLGQGAWKRKLKQAVKTQTGFSTIMSVLAAEETRNRANIVALTPPTTSPNTSAAAISSAVTEVAQVLPATKITLNSIVKRK